MMRFLEGLELIFPVTAGSSIYICILTNKTKI